MSDPAGVAGASGARAYAETLLARIAAREPELHVFAAFDPARALRLAGACDALHAAGAEARPLHGLPVGVKDIIDTADLPTQMGSPIFAGHQPVRDAAIVARLKAAGAYVIGKTQTTEFAFMNPAPTRNPWNVAHTPGGSSAGSAAGVAAGFFPAAIGTQTNGSVIRPAAFCGVVGFKPTFGLLPWAGGLQFSETLDQPGVFAPTVAAAARLAAPLAEGETIAAAIAPLDRPPRIGALEHYPWNAAEAEAAAHFGATLDRLRAAGAYVERITLPSAFADANIVHRIVMLFEAARHHGKRYAEHGERMSAVARAGFAEGLAIAADRYREMVARRAALAEQGLDLFEDFDVIVSPPAPGPAPARLDITGDPSFCSLWSLLGYPAIAVPSGFSTGRMPFGLQLAAAAGQDQSLLRSARWCEGLFGFTGLV